MYARELLLKALPFLEQSVEMADELGADEEELHEAEQLVDEIHEYLLLAHKNENS